MTNIGDHFDVGIENYKFYRNSKKDINTTQINCLINICWKIYL